MLKIKKAKFNVSVANGNINKAKVNAEVGTLVSVPGTFAIVCQGKQNALALSKFISLRRRWNLDDWSRVTASKEAFDKLIKFAKTM